MDQGRRSLVVGALVELAGSDDFRDRADAGRALASFVEVPGARELLLRLVLDAHDTYVTRETAEALLRRQDAAGLMIVAEALGRADDNHSTYINDAVRAVFAVIGSERDRALEICEALSRDADARVRQGIDELREMLVEVRPG